MASGTRPPPPPCPPRTSQHFRFRMFPWCSWLSRQSNTLKVAGSSPAGNITLFASLLRGVGTFCRGEPWQRGGKGQEGGGGARRRSGGEVEGWGENCFLLTPHRAQISPFFSRFAASCCPVFIPQPAPSPPFSRISGRPVTCGEAWVFCRPAIIWPLGGWRRAHPRVRGRGLSVG